MATASTSRCGWRGWRRRAASASRARAAIISGGGVPLPCEDRGEQNVKNIAQPVRAYALRPERVASLPARKLPARLNRTIIGTAAAAALIVVCLSWWFWPAETLFSRAGTSADQAAASATPMPTAPAAALISQPLVAPRLAFLG